VVNFLKTGILYADRLSTVSATYAREIQTEDFGMGLQDLLAARADSLDGVVNGVDYGVWSPERDEAIPYRFSADDLEGKARNKRALLDVLRLPYDRDAPVFGIVSRLTGQKGFDLLFQVLPGILAEANVRLCVLGSGEARYEEFFAWLTREFPTKVGYDRAFNDRLAHLIEAGSDLFLMPSRYEPCGLNQMYSLRYGTVPIVRNTGGLADTVEPFDRATGEGTGFVFDHYTPDGLRWAIRAALDVWRDRDAWARLVRNGMSRDFSWEHQSEHYVEIYRRLAGR
jgi:starch synthase